MNPRPKAIRAITLFVEDFEATKAFYRKVFGLDPVMEDDDSAGFRFGDSIVNVLKVAAAPELIEPTRVAAPDAGARAMYTVMVGDVDAMAIEVARQGVPLLNGPMDRPWGVRTAAFQDPAGNVWEVAQPITT